MNTVFDPLRRKEVPATPEEAVRQWFIAVLKDECQVPVSLMNSEVSLSMGAKQYRADILVWDRSAAPLAVVECKRPHVKLSSAVLDQAVRYNIALNVDWIFLTNGKSTVVLEKDAGGIFKPVNKLPSYAEMQTRR